MRGFADAGLGLRSRARHANGAYIASRIQALKLCQELDDHFVWEGADNRSLLAQSLAALNFELPDQHKSRLTLPLLLLPLLSCVPACLLSSLLACLLCTGILSYHKLQV